MGSGHHDWRVQALHTKRHQKQAPRQPVQTDRKKQVTAAGCPCWALLGSGIATFAARSSSCLGVSMVISFSAGVLI